MPSELVGSPLAGENFINSYESAQRWFGALPGQVAISMPAFSKDGVAIAQNGGDEHQLTWAEVAAVTSLSPAWVNMPPEHKALMSNDPTPIGYRLQARLGTPSADFGAQAIWDQYEAIKAQAGEAAANEFALEMIGILDSAAQVADPSKKLALGTAHSLTGLSNHYSDPQTSFVLDLKTGKTANALGYGRELLYEVAGDLPNRQALVYDLFKNMPVLGPIPTVQQQIDGDLSASEIVLSHLDLRTPDSPGWTVLAKAASVSAREATGELPEGSTEAFFVAALDMLRYAGGGKQPA